MNKLFLMRAVALLLAGLLAVPVAFSEEQEVQRKHARIDLSDLPALQRGAQLFMNYCSGCHSLKYVRYQTMAEDLGIVDSAGQLLSEAVKRNLMFVGDQLQDPIKSAMPAASGAAWFGVPPPRFIPGSTFTGRGLALYLFAILLCRS